MSVWHCPTCKTLGAFNYGVCASCGGQTRFATFPPMTPEQIASADRFKKLFKPVPLSDAEKLPDPDYGL